jgi:hypothetical protein
MSDPKRQHWVPMLYLREFATPETDGENDPDVWLFHKDDGDPFKTSISNVAVQSFFYSTLSEAAGRDFNAEHKLRDLENAVGPVWKRFAKQFVDLDDTVVRKGIGLFIATLFHRNPQRIDDHVELTNQLTEPGRSESVAQPETTRGTHKDGFVHTLLTESGPTAEELIKKRWAVIVSDAPVFATSDNPVMVLHEDLFLRGLGFFGADILVPISPTRMMILDDRHNEGNHYYKLHIETLGAFHGIVLRYALRFMISSRPSDEILAELNTLTEQLDK